jgi:hypothetical protein
MWSIGRNWKKVYENYISKPCSFAWTQAENAKEMNRDGKRPCVFRLIWYIL